MHFVREGFKACVPWYKLQGQIYLGGEDFIKKHQPNRPIKELPREQTQACRPELKVFVRENREHRIRHFVGLPSVWLSDVRDRKIFKRPLFDCKPTIETDGKEKYMIARLDPIFCAWAVEKAARAAIQAESLS